MATPSLNQFQRQALDTLRRQHDAYLGAVREWKKASGTDTGFAFGKMPEMPTAPATSSADEPPTPQGIAETNQAFMIRALEEQQRFYATLNDILGSK